MCTPPTFNGKDFIAKPARLLVTSKSPISIGAFVASPSLAHVQ
jgi:hypothetical protein